MFSKKNKSEQKSMDQATIMVQAASLSDEQRRQIEQSLSSLDPTWEGSRFRLSIPMDTHTQEQLSQLVSMFPHGSVHLETTTGGDIIMSGGGQEYGPGYRPTDSPHATRQNTSDKLSPPVS